MRLLRQPNVILAINPGKYDSSNYTLVYQKLPAEEIFTAEPAEDEFICHCFNFGWTVWYYHLRG